MVNYNNLTGLDYRALTSDSLYFVQAFFESSNRCGASDSVVGIKVRDGL